MVTFRSKGGIGGRILTTASAAGIIVSPFGDIEGSGYSMSKFANVVMTRMFPYFRKEDLSVSLYLLQRISASRSLCFVIAFSSSSEDLLGQ